MALKFGKPAPKGETSPEPAASASAPKLGGGLPKTGIGALKAGTSLGGSKPAGNKAPVASFLKRGAVAKQEQVKVEAAAEMRKAEQGKLWRLWIPDGGDRRITFLDGDLDEDGLLDINMVYEHTLKVNGDFQHFICTADQDQTQPCPLCEAGDHNSYVGLLTIIDHQEHTVKSGKNAGKVIKNARKLYVAKQNTLKMLNKLAAKRGGLAGCTFDVSRTGDREPAVGNQYDFHHKFESYEEMIAEFKVTMEELQPANYAEELVYRSPEELTKMGIGKSHAKKGFGYEKGVQSGGSLNDEL